VSDNKSLVREGTSLDLHFHFDKVRADAMLSQFKKYMDLTEDGSHVTQEDFDTLTEMLGDCFDTDVQIH
jgi:hypothetical protein